jgi:hypothetical protein
LSAEKREKIPFAVRSWLRREAFLSDINGATLTEHSITDINASRLNATAEQPAQEIASDVLVGNAPAFSSRGMAIEVNLKSISTQKITISRTIRWILVR